MTDQRAATPEPSVIPDATEIDGDGPDDIDEPQAAENTRRAYGADWRTWITWCAVTDKEALPTTPVHLAEYASHLANAGKAPATIERALAAIATAHRTAELPLPDLQLARRIVRGYESERAKAGIGQRKAAPVTTSVLRAMTVVCSSFTAIGIRDRALLVLGFTLAAKRSELVALNLADVVEGPAGLEVSIGVDGNGKARKVAIPYASVPRTCAVRLIREWRELLTAAGITDGPLFIRIDRHGKLGNVATGRGSADGRLSSQSVARIVRRTAIRAGLDPAGCWSGHSLRRGLATEAYRGGADTVVIAKHGGWTPGSRTLADAIDSVDRWETNPLRNLDL